MVNTFFTVRNKETKRIEDNKSSRLAKSARRLPVMALAAGMALVSATDALAFAEFKFDGVQAGSAPISIQAGVEYDLDYTGGGSACTDVEWYLRKEGFPTWENVGSYESDELEAQFRAGSHELKMVATGYDGRWFFNLFGCNRSGQVEERVVTLNLDTPGMTQTVNPIMLVPGVMGYDALLFGQLEYFYQIGDEIERESDLPVKDVSLHPWQNTEDRAADLAFKILQFVNQVDPYSDDPANSTMKVNLIAHSHGATTSRLAVRILADQFDEMGLSNNKIASLTTVAGPHYGTATADGANWVMDNWGTTGDIMFDVLIDGVYGNLVGGAVAFLSGHSDDYPEMETSAVLKDFTQEGMARFNTCYPSAGVHTGGKYFFEDNLPGNANSFEFDFVINNGEITVNDCNDFATFNGASANGVYTASAPIEFVSDPNLAYGAGSRPGAVFGDGLGTPMNGNEENAIRYYSFTGEGAWNTVFQNCGFSDLLACIELADPALLVIHSMHQVVGEQTDSDYFGTWLSNTLNGDIPQAGYHGASDAFIPVDSTRFGEYFGEFGPWNHVDEQNGLLGFVSESADDPKTVYTQHVNRLQLDGL